MPQTSCIHSEFSTIMKLVSVHKLFKTKQTNKYLLGLFISQVILALVVATSLDLGSAQTSNSLSEQITPELQERAFELYAKATRFYDDIPAETRNEIFGLWEETKPILQKTAIKTLNSPQLPTLMAKASSLAKEYLPKLLERANKWVVDSEEESRSKRSANTEERVLYTIAMANEILDNLESIWIFGELPEDVQ